jgi:hypothetical protein
MKNYTRKKNGNLSDAFNGTLWSNLWKVGCMRGFGLVSIINIIHEFNKF